MTTGMVRGGVVALLVQGVTIATSITLQGRNRDLQPGASRTSAHKQMSTDVITAKTLMISAPSFAPYPGYSGLTVSGTVQIRAVADDSASMTLEWSLDGIDPLCTSGAGAGFANGCGIHVHSGTSCADAALVGGHYYDSSVVTSDPWADIVYVASGTASSGSTTVATGLKLSDMEGKAFVVHQVSGGRIACGILSSSSLTTGLSTLSAYPGYTGAYTSVSGTVTIRAATDDSALQTLDWDLSAIDPSCTSGAGDGVANGCGIHVHSGTSCDVAANVGGHYYNPSVITSDPWADIVYVASGTASSGSTTVVTGLKLSEIVGRAFVVHQQSGGRIACGILQGGPTTMSVSSGISPYPGYTGALAVTGVVTLTGDTTQTLKWDLAGLDTACVSGAGDSVTNGCGIHVHSGMSCDVAANVGGHYYSGGLTVDPWSDVVYISDGLGKSSSSTTVNTGLKLWELAGRAFVIHELASGARIACGTLVAGETVSAADFASYPGYTGGMSVAGTVNIASSGVGSQVLTWDLTGVDTLCSTPSAGDSVANGCGIHVHSGSTCAVATGVGGHYYSTTLTSDPWAPIVYVADGSGTSKGAVEVVTGLTLADQVGKAFVVHQLTSGGRVACSIVNEPASSASAVGDPHLQNVHGERFDLMQAGKHVLINIPRGTSAQDALLRVQADAQRFGGSCADMYFQEVNVTGSWAEAKQAGGYHYSVSHSVSKAQGWVAFGNVELKVVHGRTNSGLLYLNVFVKHLGRAGYVVGGLLGEDDHEAVSIPPAACGHHLSLLQPTDGGQSDAPSVFSVAVASLA